jgi:hypothetical protein
MAATIGSFVALEVYALMSAKYPTLSEVLRSHLGINPRARHGTVAPVLFLGFWAWLTKHLVEWQLREWARSSRSLFFSLALGRTRTLACDTLAQEATQQASMRA